MEDYHVFSSADLVHWKDHGVIISQNKVKWVDSTACSMWAPDCIFRDDHYYFYFPSPSRDSALGKGFRIGVAVGTRPGGPFIPLDTPIRGVRGIDPNVFMDKDGQAYLYWAQGNIYGARLSDNMVELASEPKILGELPSKGLKEGPWLFERGGIYYLTYPHVQDKTERLEYAMGYSPLGPFKYAGVIMDEWPNGCWTNHQTIMEFKGQWYLFYHHNDLSPDFDKNRSICADSLFFNGDGSIRRVMPSLRGVGVTKAWDTIQVDRYSHLSESGASVEFLDTMNRFKGWKLVLQGPKTWAQYNSVEFGEKKLKTLALRVRSAGGNAGSGGNAGEGGSAGNGANAGGGRNAGSVGTLEIRVDGLHEPVICQVSIPAGDGWRIVDPPLKLFPPGMHDLYLIWKGNGVVDVDWVSFK
jgi:hypothetical protein